MFGGGLVVYLIFSTFLCLFFVITTIWLCYLEYCYDTHQDVDSSIAEADDDNYQAFEIECMGNPNVEVKIDFIILTLNR